MSFAVPFAAPLQIYEALCTSVVQQLFSLSLVFRTALNEGTENLCEASRSGLGATSTTFPRGSK